MAAQRMIHRACTRVSLHHPSSSYGPRVKEKMKVLFYQDGFGGFSFFLDHRTCFIFFGVSHHITRTPRQYEYRSRSG